MYGKMKRAQIPIQLLSTIVVTIVAIGLVFVLIASNTNLGKNLLCKAEKTVRIKDVSENCTQEMKREAVEIKSDPVTKITQFIIDCWERSKKGSLDYGFICTHAIMLNPKKISETDITDQLIDREICHIIENSFDDNTGEQTECGEEDNIRFIQNITSPNVLIEYNHETRQIIVS